MGLAEGETRWRGMTACAALQTKPAPAMENRGRFNPLEG